MNDAEESGLVSAIWILACNDEKSLMLFESIKYRLGLSKIDEMKQIIEKYGELFRLNLPKSQLNAWKDEMKKSSKKGPSYIIEIEDKSKRDEIIDNLKSEDGFRSQFRTEANSPKSDTTLINWGLEHIERRRKANLEAKDSKLKWLNNGVIPILTTLITLSALFLTYWSQTASIESQEALKKYELDSQERLKKYEVSFNLRNESYVSIMKSFEIVTESIENHDKTNFQTNLEQLESSYYKIRPFLRIEAQSRLSSTLKDFNKYMNDSYNKGSSKNFPIKEQIMYKEFRHYFEETLYKDLFERSDYVNTPVTSTTK